MFNLAAFTAIHPYRAQPDRPGDGYPGGAGPVRGRIPGTTGALYFVTSVLTSATGFGFPFTRFLLSHGVGILSPLALAPTQAEPSFAIVERVILLVFIGLTVVAQKGLRRNIALA